MVKKSNPPTTSETAFDCPYCGVFTTQNWYNLGAKRLDREQRVPFFPNEETMASLDNDTTLDGERKAQLKTLFDKLRRGLVFFENIRDYVDLHVYNAFLSQCYNCKRIAVWVHQTLVFPAQRVGPEPNPDLPGEVASDVEEARTILNSSPRGAAALLRLCIQKLCAALGEKGKNIDDDIASLVAKGLNPLVQQALDVVRVIGNEAVHPGIIDLKDDRDTALRILALVNIIGEQMISQPRMINEMYEMLPEAKKQAIKARNEQALKKL